jgi:NADPH:quinone reductase-like Zn-dependent oxidoreductase
VIGTAGPANHEYLRSLGAEPVAYGQGLVERVRGLTPDGVDTALDVAGSGVLAELIELAGGPQHVVTIADFGGAQQYGVRFSSGDAGRAHLPARRDRAGAPRQRGRSRAREARAAGRLTRAADRLPPNARPAPARPARSTRGHTAPASNVRLKHRH